MDARMGERIVHRLARGGEDIGLKCSRIRLEVFLPAAGETSGGCVGEAVEISRLALGKTWRIESGMKSLAFCLSKARHVQIEVIQQAEILSLVGEISLDLGGFGRGATNGILICICHGGRNWVARDERLKGSIAEGQE